MEGIFIHVPLKQIPDLVISMKKTLFFIIIGLVSFIGVDVAIAQAYAFNLTLHGESSKNADMDSLVQSGQLPETDILDVQLNSEQVNPHDMIFILQPYPKGWHSLEAGSSREYFSCCIKAEALPEFFSTGSCAGLSVTPQLFFDFQHNDLLLSLNA